MFYFIEIITLKDIFSQKSGPSLVNDAMPWHCDGIHGINKPLTRPFITQPL